MRNNSLINIQWAVIVILIALLAAPYLVSHASSAANSGSMAGMSPDMMQKLYPLDDTGAATPTVSFEIKKDSLDGWNVHITASNFNFTPQNIGGAPVADQGHAHLYIDGALTVVMGPWYHIDSSAIGPGKHTIAVSLNANDHSAFAYAGKPIEATQTLYVY